MKRLSVDFSFFRRKKLRTKVKYTQTTSKIENLPRRRPEFKSGEAGAEAAQLE